MEQVSHWTREKNCTQRVYIMVRVQNIKKIKNDSDAVSLPRQISMVPTQENTLPSLRNQSSSFGPILKFTIRSIEQCFEPQFFFWIETLMQAHPHDQLSHCRNPSLRSLGYKCMENWQQDINVVRNPQHNFSSTSIKIGYKNSPF